MELSIPVTRSDAHRLRDPASVVWIGVAIPNDQTPERAEAVRDALVEAGAEIVPTLVHADDALLGIQDDCDRPAARGRPRELPSTRR